MVLERLISMKIAIRQPIWLLIIGAILSVISLVVSFLIFKSSVGLFTTLFITIAMTPLMINLGRYDEQKEEEGKNVDKIFFLQRHREILIAYSAFFIGITLSMSLTYLMLPQNWVEAYSKTKSMK